MCELLQGPPLSKVIFGRTWLRLESTVDLSLSLLETTKK